MLALFASIVSGSRSLGSVQGNFATNGLCRWLSSVPRYSDVRIRRRQETEPVMIQKKLFGTLLAMFACLAIGLASNHSLCAQPPFGTLPDELLPPSDETPEQPEEEPPARLRPPADRAPIRPFDRPIDEEEVPDQPVKLNAKYAGWEGAGTGTGSKRLSDDIRANWIMVDENGKFSGRVVPMDNAAVGEMTVFLMNQGRLVKQAYVDEQGMYEFTNVRQGAYALIGWSETAFFAFGLNILSYTDDANPQIRNNVTTLAFQNQTTINTDWIRFFAPQVSFRVYGRYPEDEGPSDSASLYGFIGLVENQPDAAPATSISGHNVHKTPDGRLVGRVHQLTSLTGRPVDLRSTKVMLLQGDDVAASTTTDNYGVFEFTDVAPGRYALTAVGVDGMGLVGINVVNSDETLMTPGGELRDADVDESLLFDFCLTSSETAGWLNHYATEVAYRRALLAPRPPRMAGNCPACNGAGCSHCEPQKYLDGPCVSRQITFEQWASQCRGPYCQYRATQPSGPGSGARRVVNALDEAFERAFYSNSGNGISGGGGGNYGYYPGSDGAYNSGYYQGYAPGYGAGYVPSAGY